MKRKILSLLLALCLVVGMIPLAASAEDAAEPAKGTTADNPFTSVKEYNDAVKGDALNGKDVYLKIDSQTFDNNGFNLTNVQKREDPPKLHLFITNSSFTGNTSEDSSKDGNTSFMYLSNCQELVIEGCIFNAGESGLKYGINWNLIQIQGAEVTIRDCEFTGNYTKNALKLNQRGGDGDEASDIKVEGTSKGASIKSAVIEGCTFDGENAIIALGSAGKGTDGAAAPSTGDFSVTITNTTVNVLRDYMLGNSSSEDEKKNAVVQATPDKPFTQSGVDVKEETISQKEAVASVNGTNYSSLEEAIKEAAGGATVTLLDNVALTDGIEIDKTITLDLNGKTISKASDGWTGGTDVDYLVAVKRGGNLTIEDSGDTGTINASGLACGVKMTIKGETEDGKEAVLTVNGGTIQGGSFGISGNGTRHGTKITINGGTIKNTDNEGTAIYHPQDGELTVNGGTIESSNTGIEIRSGTLTVTGGKISGGNGEPGSIVNGGGTTTSNAAVAIAQHTTEKLIEVNISGGTLTGGAALYESDPNNIYSDTTVDKPDIEVTGGTFTGAVSSENVSGFITGGNFSATDLDKYIADGYELVGGAVKEEQEPTPPPVIVPSNPTYTNTVSDAENGKVTASPTRPKEGATVTVTATPDKGYEVGSVSVTDADGKAVAVTNAGNGKYTFKQPDSKVTIKVTFVWDNPFTDVGNAWYRNAIQYVYENNLMAGTSDTTFDPEVSLTRAMTAQILYNLEGQPEVDEEATFADMNEAPTWSVDAIAWAQDTGVVAGMGDNEFDPNAKVIREQFAQMMYNYAKYKKYDLTKTGDLSKFPDDGSVSDWAETALSWANGNGLINGHAESGLLDPQGNTIRGQAASIIMNFDKNVVK